MQAYLVGGAVRDRLLGLPVRDRDWVVVGRTQEQMIAEGYRQVGSDFPVFLHPETNEEYALARTERKTAPGYRGFSIHADPDVTLEQDLERRDITINAIAEETDGTLIDPFNGERDLNDRILRHVSSAFAEDPVRILRVARFAARLQPFGFTVADETLELMRQMVDAGEVDALVPERVWQELRGAMASAKPSVFINVLRDANALQIILPEVEALFGIPQPPEHHPEIDSGVHTLMVVDLAANLAATSFNETDQGADAAQQRSARIVFAALCHDLGKALTPKEEWPSHRGHEKSGVPVVEALCHRLRTPADVRKLAMMVCLHHLSCHRATEMRAGKLVKTLMAIDALRRPQRLEEFLLVCEADYRGRGTGERKNFEQAAYMLRVLEAIRSVDAGAIAASRAKLMPASDTRADTKANKEKVKKAEKKQKPDSESIKNAIHQARVRAVKVALGDSTKDD